ncbi:hypothetical protein J3F84DRAFT_365259 [Trichoderma pleuroticola]
MAAHNDEHVWAWGRREEKRQRQRVAGWHPPCLFPHSSAPSANREAAGLAILPPPYMPSYGTLPVWLSLCRLLFPLSLDCSQGPPACETCPVCKEAFPPQPDGVPDSPQSPLLLLAAAAAAALQSPCHLLRNCAATVKRDSKDGNASCVFREFSSIHLLGSTRRAPGLPTWLHQAWGMYIHVYVCICWLIHRGPALRPSGGRNRDLGVGGILSNRR